MPPKKSIQSRRKRTLTFVKPVNEEVDPYDMDETMFQYISNFLGTGGDYRQVNFFLPGKTNLYENYLKYKKNRDTNLRHRKQQALVDDFNKQIDYMEEVLQFGLLLSTNPKKRKKSKNKEDLTEDERYKTQYAELDARISLIELMIYLAFSDIKIATKLCSVHEDENGKKLMPIHGLNPLIFKRWADTTKYKERLFYAYKASADTFMQKGLENLQAALNNPNLSMQASPIVRELSLYYSRMGEFMDRKKYGKKFEITNEVPAPVKLEGKNIGNFIESLFKAGGIEDEKVEEDEFSEFEDENVEDELGENEEFTDFEEVK
jgi:hypothetical protein